eukprot:TRINITY_DN33733_c0_g1_i1.p1 TRINITY_DN33733_c0_g1~~TRINITY_DN33733_c0_g1_i1.p1  ORF type:complete len:546 (+),score=140.51 TRINITY_DN33733_c0_g1_i1:40-1677(+)
MAKHRENKDSTLMTIAMLGVVLGLFTFAYKLGASQGSDRHVSGLTRSREKDVALTTQLSKCHEENDYKQELLDTELKGEAEKAYNTRRSLEIKTQKLRARTNDLFKMQTNCLESADLQRSIRENQDNIDIAELAKLEVIHNNLQKRVQRLNTTQSLEAKLLIANIGKLANEHNRLRQSLGLQQVSITPEDLTELMMKWSSLNSAKFHERLGDILPPNRTEISSNYKQPLKVDEAHQDDVEYFTAQHDDTPNYADRVWSKPEWKGIVGNRPLSYGIMVDAPIQRSTAPRLMRMLYEYMLCASGVNITDLAFPAHFQNSEGDIENLSDLIVTPHVFFCRDCSTQHQSSAFRLLCLGYSSAEQYGSRLFWKTRSKLVPSDKIRNEASAFLADHDPSKMMGVRLPKSAHWTDKCKSIITNHEKPLMFKTALLNGTEDVSTDKAEQCDPPLSLVSETLNEWARKLEIEKIFVSTDMDQTQWGKLATSVKYPLVRVPAGTYSSPSVAALVDISIASQLRAIMVNRYDVWSAHITEYFMLGNKFSTRNIKVW